KSSKSTIWAAPASAPPPPPPSSTTGGPASPQPLPPPDRPRRASTSTSLLPLRSAPHKPDRTLPSQILSASSLCVSASRRGVPAIPLPRTPLKPPPSPPRQKHPSPVIFWSSRQPDGADQNAPPHLHRVGPSRRTDPPRPCPARGGSRRN